MSLDVETPTSYSPIDGSRIVASARIAPWLRRAMGSEGSPAMVPEFPRMVMPLEIVNVSPTAPLPASVMRLFGLEPKTTAPVPAKVWLPPTNRSVDAAASYHA